MPSQPILIRSNGDRGIPLKRAALNAPGAAASYDESWLQKLLYDHPECLPIADIDDSFANLVPVCRELNTPAGYIDVLFVTPTGRLVVVEAKLWRNPEARRKVIGQILDYAKDLSRMTFEQLDAQVVEARRRQRADAEPAHLVDIVAAHKKDQAAFIDGVSRSLQRGDMLLLIVGDGIREGAGAIAEFLDRNATLHFTFGLVEMAIYDVPDGGRLVQPRVLAQSEIVRRFVVSVEAPGVVVTERPEIDDDDAEADATPFTEFWRELLHGLKLRDQSQPLPDPPRAQNLYLAMPTGSKSWVSAFLAQTKHRAGVYLTFERGPIGDRLYAALEADRDAIDRELDKPVVWESDGRKHKIAMRQEYRGNLLTDHRNQVQAWLSDGLDRFVTVFRPRIARLLHDTV